MTIRTGRSASALEGERTVERGLHLHGFEFSYGEIEVLAGFFPSGVLSDSIPRMEARLAVSGSSYTA